AVFAESPKTRLAEPGEFTRQAFENGCLDLTQVEGLADLIAAETHEQLVLANRVFGGAFSAKVTAWRADLIRACALLEAMIDFADEDIPQDLNTEVLSLIDKTLKSLSAEITGTKIAERIRNGFEVAIIGRPNIGKSTLLNTLAGRKVALTSEIAGTTRDIIEVRMDIKGLPVTILDTAGLRDTDDTVESLGVDWARDRAEAADIRVFLLDDTGLDGLGISVQKDDIILRGKVDETPDFKGAGVSGKTGQGIDFVMKNIVRILSPRILPTQTATRERHRVAMQSASLALQQAGDSIKSDSFAVELVATDIRTALGSLNHMIGAVGVEDILDEIFASFCLGK
ncbi:MAG: 50S ribosome-binding GTPase, partial [Proteobacteria bacterium]|nr:50S ribosome-binding GTPase [Pseudomonadota bacterium]